MAIVLSGMLTAGIFTPWGIPVGSALILIPFYFWAWPDKGEHARNLREERQRDSQGEPA
jgi:hypothetical protein